MCSKGEVHQEQAVLRFAMGCQDTRAGKKLIESTKKVPPPL